MAIMNKLSAAVPTSLIYITIGTLIDIWTIVWLVYNPPETNNGNFWIVGFLMTGLALLVIGLFLGQIGRAARSAELPPHEVTPAAAQAEQLAAAHPPLAIPTGTVVQSPGVQIPGAVPRQVVATAPSPPTSAVANS